jgi:TolB-like protein
MKDKRLPLRLMMIFLVALCFLLPHPSSGAEPKKVAILPFTMNADRDLTFLQDGITDMLASRLAWKGEVEVLQKAEVRKALEKVTGPLSPPAALEIGKTLKANYVILGSLTVFGDSVSIDARILDVAGGEELVTAFSQTKGMDEVIPTVNRFAQDINEKIMGRAVAPPAYATAPDYGDRSPRGLVPGEDAFGQGVEPVISNYRTHITGLAVADLDGDGENELLFIDEHTLYIARWDGRRFLEMGRFGGARKNQYVWLDTADTDRDGKSEIYVSNILGDTLDSLALEWRNDRIVPLATGQKWFFRVTDLPGKGRVLLGQQRRVGGDFIPSVYILNREGGHFSKQEKLDLPRWANAFNFAMGDISGSGKTEIMMIGYDQKLEFYDSKGEVTWKSDDDYGGKPISFTYRGDKEALDLKYFFMPSRVELTDADGDGRNEVMVCQNKEKIGSWLSAARIFTNGRVEFLKWGGMGMTTFMKTVTISRYISDYRVADVDNDGNQELLLSVVKDYAFYRGKGSRSQIVVYDLEEKK